MLTIPIPNKETVSKNNKAKALKLIDRKTRKQVTPEILKSIMRYKKLRELLRIYSGEQEEVKQAILAFGDKYKHLVNDSEVLADILRFPKGCLDVKQLKKDNPKIFAKYTSYKPVVTLLVK